MLTGRAARDVWRFAAASWVIIGATCSSASADKTVYYSDSCVERESGDIAGYVVIVSDGRPLPLISFSWSEGALKQPVVAKITNYDRKSGQLSFSVSIDWDEGIKRDIKFDGNFSSDRMTGAVAMPGDTTGRPIELEVRSRKAAFEPPTTCQSG